MCISFADRVRMRTVNSAVLQKESILYSPSRPHGRQSRSGLPHPMIGGMVWSIVLDTRLSTRLSSHSTLCTPPPFPPNVRVTSPTLRPASFRTPPRFGRATAQLSTTSSWEAGRYDRVEHQLDCLALERSTHINESQRGTDFCSPGRARPANLNSCDPSPLRGFSPNPGPARRRAAQAFRVKRSMQPSRSRST